MGFLIGTDGAFGRSILTPHVKELNVNRNGLYLIIGALIVVATGLAFLRLSRRDETRRDRVKKSEKAVFPSRKIDL
ncbi:hypothetical protein JS562_51515 [Agrobacterium sp. S2]|nr:hypothetical protein [Agrobacterium sp. S2]